MTKKGAFSPSSHRDQWVDWVITNNYELKFGHGHSFMSGHSKTIINAGSAQIINGKITRIVNSSGHYPPLAKYLDEVFPFFKNLGILSETVLIHKWKPKKR